MPSTGDPSAPRAAPGVLRVLLALTSLALATILVPFYGTLLWAVVIALVFAPLQRHLRQRMNGRATLAALLTVTTVLLLGVLPMLAVGVGMMSELNALSEGMQSGDIRPEVWLRRLVEMLPPSLVELLEQLGVGNERMLQRRVQGLYNELGEILTTSALSYGQHTFEWLVCWVIMLYVAFFLLRDGPELAATINESLPLAPRHKRLLRQKFTAVILASVKGTLLVALLQGALGGLAFWVLGLHGPLLWSVVMVFLSLLPAVGAMLVWGPAAVYLLVDGRTSASIGLVVWGLLVIGLIDNLLRPKLVGKESRLPDWVVLLATLGGMTVFGVHGFVIGPLIAAMFFAVWQIVLVERRGGIDEVEPVPPSHSKSIRRGLKEK